MNLRRFLFAGLFLVMLTRPGFGQGITYPDGSVSPFQPGFFGVGIPSPATASYVFGVGAQGGTFRGAVGQINGLDFGIGQEPYFWGPTGSQGLPRVPGATNGGTASGISSDGTLKVGDAGGAAYWDADNQLHLLPSSGGSESTNGAAAITPSGLSTSLIVGSVLIESRDNGVTINEAAVWTLNGLPPKKLGKLPNFDSSTATGISEFGSSICGFSTKYGPGGVGQIRPFVYQLLSETMTSLGTLGGNQDANAFAISEASASHMVIVGSHGPPGLTQGVAWTLDLGSPFAFPLDAGIPSAGYAVRANMRANQNESAGRIVGFNANSQTGSAAFMWDAAGHVKGTIKGLLGNPYKVSTARDWNLTIAYTLSGDGYTVGGTGINPQGKQEGWVAVMPPILHPPILVRPPNQIAPPGEAFFYQVHATNDPEKRASYSAKNLPKGFSIDNTGRIAGLWSSNDTAIIGDYSVTVSAKTSQGTSTTTFTISLRPPPDAGSPPKSQSIQGHTFLPQNKPPDEETFLASFANGTSSNGQVAVGQDGLFNDARAYRWTPTEGSSGLPMLDGALRTFSTASAVSADGNTIVGQSAAAPADDGSNRSVATVWKTLPAISAKAIRKVEHHYAETAAVASLEAINLGLFPGGLISLATGVSADGLVVVGYGDAKDPDPNFKFQVYQAFRWTQSTGRVGLGWIDQAEKVSQAWGVSPDGSVVVGTDSAQAFRWTQATGMVGLGKGPGALGCRATGVSADNSTIIGFNTYNAANDNNRAFRWTASEGFVDLGVLPGAQYSEAKAISANGSIIAGQSGIKFGTLRAFIWDKTNGMRDLKEVLIAGNPSLANWTLRSATGISADGKTIVGSGTNPNGDPEGFTAVLEVRPAQLLNIATRMRVLAGDKALIGGFIITGTEPKKVMIRGIGPSLSAFFSGALTDPTLTLFQGNTPITGNDNWKTRTDGSSQESEIRATTIPPGNDLESAILITLSPGAYTAILADKNGWAGIGLVEVFDLAQQTNSKLANISTRGFVDTGDNVMIGGFIAGGGSPGATAGEVIRAIDPSLTGAGVPGALQDTILELYNSSGTLLASNDNWKLRADGTSQEAEIRATTIPPGDERESALAVTLAPGNYTAVVRGKGSATGIGLVEVFHLQ